MARPGWHFFLLLSVAVGLSLPACSRQNRSAKGGEAEGEGGGAEGEGEGGGEGEGEAWDAALPDGGQADTGQTDAGFADTGPVDSGPVDSGPIDSGLADTGPPACSPDQPDGVCPGELICTEGECLAPACSPEHPDGVCAGELICIDGECLPPACDEDHPDGRCDPGLVCRDGSCVEPRLETVAVALVQDGPPEGQQPGPGAGNGLPDAGELIGLAVEVRNLSETAYLSLSARLISEDPGAAEVVEGAALQPYPELRNGQQASAASPFLVRLGTRLPDAAQVPLLLAFTDSRHGEVDTLRLGIGVRRGVLLAAGQVFVDDDRLGVSQGDGDHRLDPGETIELQIDLANRGPVPLPLPPLPGDLPPPDLSDAWVQFELTSSGPAVQVVPGEHPPSFSGALAAGAVAESAAKLVVRVDDGAQHGERVCLTFGFLLGAGESTLYRFSEIRCLAIGDVLGPVCDVHPEECNEQDDDCNGLVDDGLPLNACGHCGPPPEEVCNGVDDDCDGQTDEEPLSTPAGTCPAPIGVCVQATPFCRGAQGWTCEYPPTHEELDEQSCDGLDNDCDGSVDEELTAPAGTCPAAVGVCGQAAPTCRGAQGWSCSFPATHEVPEQTCDGLDNDCDGSADEDLTAPAHLHCHTEGVCQGIVPHCGGAAGWGCTYPATYEQTEQSCDGLDNDCDGQTDEELTTPAGTCPAATGVCALASPACHGAQGWSCSFPATYEEVEQACDGLDNDCDGQTDEGLTAPPGTCPAAVGVCALAEPVCQGAQGWSCSFPATHEEVEQACDGLDNDCDGQIDEGLSAPPGTCPTAVGVCALAEPVCQGAQGWSCSFPATHEEVEQTCDGLDNDCDGQTDEELTAPAGTCPAAVGVCALAAPACHGAQGWSCTFPATHEQTESRCDGLDNDCDGQTDEGLTAPPGTCPAAVGVCALAAPVCQGAQGWSCSFPATHEEVEQTCDGLDNDCDGSVDEGLAPPAGFACKTLGVCAGVQPACLTAEGWTCPYPATYQEVEQMIDGLDNDCDGQTDELGDGGPFFSEYVEGSDRNKALEIFNGSTAALDLSTCRIVPYTNGSLVPAEALPLLNQLLPPNGVYVVCNGGLNAAFLDRCDQVDNRINMNGDDTMVLECGGVVLDVFGQLGFRPEDGWPEAAPVTLNHTLRRKCSVLHGDPHGDDPFDPLAEWDVFGVDVLDDLGSYSCP